MDKFINKIIFLLILLSCIYEYYCNQCFSTSNKYNENVNQHCDIYYKKILEYKDKLKPFFDKVEIKQPLSTSEVEVATKIITEYYTYLANQNIVYGELARDVINNHGAFARLANSHLEHTAKVEGKSNKEIENIKNNLRIALAYNDVKIRSENKDDTNASENINLYKAIAKYHYNTFEDQGLSKYAWGGTILEEFAGSGSWMNIGGYDKSVDFKLMDLIEAVILNKKINGIEAHKALNSMKNIPINHLGDSLLASTYRTLITYEPIYEILKKNHNSFYAPDGHLYNFDEYKTEVLDKLFDKFKKQEPLNTFVSDEEINNNKYDHTVDDGKKETDSDSSAEYKKVVDLGSTRIIMQTVKCLKNGNIVALWCTHKNINFSDMQTSIQLHDKEGNKLKGPIELELRSVDINFEPLSDGSFVLYTKDIFHVYNKNADLITTGKLKSCFKNYYNCFIIRVIAMENNTFLFTWHERTKNNMINFKGKYYNATGNAISKNFIIYHGTQSTTCKLSNVNSDSLGIVCTNNRICINNDNIDDLDMNISSSSSNILEKVYCFATFAIAKNKKSDWMKLPIPITSEPPEILNLGHNKFVILVKQTTNNRIQQIHVKLVNNGNVLDIIKLEDQINQLYEIILTRVGDTEFLISSRDYNGHHMQSYKYNINGELVNKEMSIVTKGSNHHLTTWANKYEYIISWMHSKHNSLQKWHHFEHGYSGAWSNFEEISTSIFMVIKNNSVNKGLIENIKNWWYS